ncbi:glycosyltransferase [bacterium]|nr:glycosyltransferase [bacterium]
MKLIITVYHPWDTKFRIGDHHYVREFLNDGWDVLWISHPVSFAHGAKPENRTRIERAKSGPYRHKDGPIELVPYTMLPWLNRPLLSSQWVLENTHRFCRPPLKTSLEKIGFDKPDLVWITDASMHAIADIADPKAVVVRIADDNIEFRNIPSSLSIVEQKLANRADALFVTSSPLLDRLKPEYRSKIHLLRNGVNFDHFQGTFDRPSEFKDIDGPIVFYVGAIEEWFNSEWVKNLAEKRKDITIFLVGMVGTDLSNLKDLQNVKITGLRPYESLPGYMAHSNAGIIPFKRTQLVESVSPLKLFEFLASGLPVVSTSWSELEHLGSPALLANKSDEFVEMVSKVIDKDWKSDRGDKFRDYARSHSWKARYDTAMEVIGDFLRK